MEIYSAKYRCDSSHLIAVKKTIQQIKAYRWQILLSIKKNIKATYQQDALGLFWSILMPIIPMTVYMILAQIKVFNTVDDMPFVYYIATGMMMWLLMSTIMRYVMISIKMDKSILTTTGFPIIATMLSQLGGVLNETAIRLIAIAAIIGWYRFDISMVSVILALLSLIPAIIMAFALGIILSILDVVIQDTRRIVDIFLRYGLFASSVIFPFPSDGIMGLVNQINFFNTYVNATRDLLYYGSTSELPVFITTSIIGLLLLVVSIKLVYSLDFKIRAYL